MRALLFACVLIVLAAASAPGLVSRYIERSAGASAAGPAATEPAPAPAPAVEIRAERDGHFYVEPLVNFRPVRMMVDTGATVVALRQSDAAAAGIRVRPSDFRHLVQTANGTTRAAEALIESLLVEDIEVRDVRALVMPDDQLAVSLLGGSFLHRLRRFEVADGTLIFEN
jgi:aspartyl protease family protein